MPMMAKLQLTYIDMNVSIFSQQMVVDRVDTDISLLYFFRFLKHSQIQDTCKSAAAQFSSYFKWLNKKGNALFLCA